MRAVDLTKLIEGLLIIILAALAVGKFGDLRRFAAHEAAASLRGWDTHAFFPETYRRIVGATPTVRSHSFHRSHLSLASSQENAGAHSAPRSPELSLNQNMRRN